MLSRSTRASIYISRVLRNCKTFCTLSSRKFQRNFVTAGKDFANFAHVFRTSRNSRNFDVSDSEVWLFSICWYLNILRTFVNISEKYAINVAAFSIKLCWRATERAEARRSVVFKKCYELGQKKRTLSFFANRSTQWSKTYWQLTTYAPPETTRSNSLLQKLFCDPMYSEIGQKRRAPPEKRTSTASRQSSMRKPCWLLPRTKSTSELRRTSRALLPTGTYVVPRVPKDVLWM